ncbi:hypothetical protein PRK78_003264 [Emydomyces testavorans]|uniref:Siderophore iron transporter mirC n=1 Tax=Emydomyces testavorans TaxID=2070801 RepID=A0AAF0DFW1_9EURO|nr:hypothetical protein PRK78_003264 [Emydomyces testavorans]
MSDACQPTNSPTYGAFETHDRIEGNDEREALLFVEPRELNVDGLVSGEDTRSSTPSTTELQEGVRKIEAISRTWTQKSLIIAYLGIFFMAFCTSLEGQTVMSLSPYATSSFSKHSLISTVLVVQNVINAVIKPPVAKIADVFGRFEAFCISILFYVLGYVQMAASKNVQTYASAQIFYSAGSTGLQILQQVFIADSSDLLNRALFASLPELPFLVTLALGLWDVGDNFACSFSTLGFDFMAQPKKSTKATVVAAQVLERERVAKFTSQHLVRAGCLWLDITFCRTHPNIVAFYLSVQPYLYSYLQVVQGQSVATAGRVTQTFSFISTVAAISVSFFIKYTGRYRPFVTGGCLAYTGGLLLMLLTHKEGSSVIETLIVQTIVGLGGGLVNVPVQLGVQASASHQEVAAATAMFLTTLEMGGAVGSAISGAVWTSFVPKRLRDYLPPESQKDADEIFGKLTKALSYPLGSPTRIAINRAYEETMETLLTIAVCVTIPLIPLSFLMKDYRLDKMAQKVKGKVIGHSAVEDDIITNGTGSSQPVPRLAMPNSRS